MPWFVVDDSAHSHPKFMKAGNAAVGLWLRCGSYAAQHLTEGIVPAQVVTMYGTAPQAARLTKAGLWHPAGHACSRCPQPEPGDYVIHDYLAYNPTRRQVDDRRTKAAQRQRRHRGQVNPEPPNPPLNRERFADDSETNRDRFDDESNPNRRPVADEFPGHEDASRRDSHVPRARAFPSPPLPSIKEGVDVGGESAGSRARGEQRPDGLAPIDVDGFTLTDGMRRWAHRDGFAALVDLDFSTQQFVSHYRSTGARRKSWPDAWQKWIRDDAKRAADRARRSLPAAAGAENVIALHGASSRFDEHVALYEKLAAEEAGSTP